MVENLGKGGEPVKVYCRDCRWSKGWHTPEIGKHCRLGNRYEDTPERRELVRGDFSDNEMNDCPNYIRKWYKFWIT